MKGYEWLRGSGHEVMKERHVTERPGRDGGNASGNGGERGGGARCQGSGGGGVVDEGAGEAGGERSATYAPPRLLDLLLARNQFHHIKHHFLIADLCLIKLRYQNS